MVVSLDEPISELYCVEQRFIQILDFNAIQLRNKITRGIDCQWRFALSHIVRK
ncbi:hypothetical protein Bealeia1_02053 (plasmid) [Candidatus Bealeia paramacronuclearis]|uniref:Uncharacterized protein n=1 Tax=Candidatus Bealeia paramacronuclearis TaxID=1921001 RepID=A0ABZ2C5X5_9PROT